jgi:hypothetical protein
MPLSLEPIPTGGVAAVLLAFAWRAFLWFTRASKQRKEAEPEAKLNDDIYRNGERWNFRRTLNELLASVDNHDERIAKLESDCRDGDRTHEDLEDRLSRLEKRYRSLRDDKP